jgi:hypothetical protein
VNTTWKYPVSSSSCCRASSQRSRACAWHFLQKSQLSEVTRSPSKPAGGDWKWRCDACSAQVAEQLGGFAEGWLGVNDPLVRHARFITAVVTHVDVSAERGGTATADSPERLQLLIAEAGLIIGRPVHGGYQRPPWRSGSWLLRAAEGMAALVDVRQRGSSSGLCTSCRCRWERWRYLAVVSKSPNLNGAQISSSFKQMGGPAVARVHF